MLRQTSLSSRLWSFGVWTIMALFVLNLIGLIAAVVTSSFATRWLGTWLPAGWTTRWYLSAWSEFQLAEVLTVTFEIVLLVVALVRDHRRAGGLRHGAARVSRASGSCMLLFLAPLLVPPITYGIPLATVLYRTGLAGTMSGVVLANLVPTAPFVILVMIPYIEQIDPRIEAAARVFGADTPRLFAYVLLPLLAPGMLAALLLALVRTIAMFELTFLTNGPTTQTLVVALYYAVFAAGVRAVQSIDAMAVIYMATSMIWLLDRAAFRQPDADRRPRPQGSRRNDPPHGREPRAPAGRRRPAALRSLFGSGRNPASRRRRLPSRPSGGLCRRPPGGRRDRLGDLRREPAFARHRRSARAAGRALYALDAERRRRDIARRRDRCAGSSSRRSTRKRSSRR